MTVCFVLLKSYLPLEFNLDLEDQPSLFLHKGCERQKVASIRKEMNQRLTPKCISFGFCHHDMCYMILETHSMFKCTVKEAWPGECL